MKHNYKNQTMKKTILILLIVALASFNTYSQDIHFTFANAQNTNDGANDFYEVDVLIEATADFKLGSGLLYFNYNMAAFGSDISVNNKIEYLQPNGYILGETYGFPAYKDFIQNDNTTSRVGLSWQQGLSSGSITANNVLSTPKLLFHIKIQYIDVNQNPTVTFETDGSFLDQTSTACGPSSAGFADCSGFPGSQILNDTFDSAGAVLGVNDNQILNIKLYPNPTQNEFKIDGILENSTLEIYTLNGILVLQQKNYTNQTVNISNLSANIYFVKISNDNGNITKKIIKN